MKIVGFPLVSILLPVRNEGAYLSQCLGSLLSQRYRNIEIVLCDNCSTDDTLSMAITYAQLDSRLKICRQPRLVDAYSNLSLCFQESSGEIIFVTGGDDYIDEDLIERGIEQFLKNSNIFSVVNKLRYFDDSSGVTIQIAPPSEFDSNVHLDPLPFAIFYSKHIHNDELILGFFERDLFVRALRIFQSPNQPVGWWMVMVIFMIGKVGGGDCVVLHNTYIHKRCNALYRQKGSGRTPVLQKSKWARQIDTMRNIGYVHNQIGLLNRSVANKVARHLVIIFTFDFFPDRVKRTVLRLKHFVLR